MKNKLKEIILAKKKIAMPTKDQSSWKLMPLLATTGAMHLLLMLKNLTKALMADFKKEFICNPFFTLEPEIHIFCLLRTKIPPKVMGSH